MRPKRAIASIGLCAVMTAAWMCTAWMRTAQGAATAVDTEATQAVRRLLATQQAEWNRADIDAFMQGYWNDPSIRFAGGDSFRYGWQATIDRYRKTYPDATAMGKLDFELLEVRELAASVVYVFGQWRLTRAIDAGDHAPHGLFTLIVEKKDGSWVVTRDHTSAGRD